MMCLFLFFLRLSVKQKPGWQNRIATPVLFLLFAVDYFSMPSNSTSNTSAENGLIVPVSLRP